MPRTSRSALQMVPEPHELDDLELVRQGVPVDLEVTLPPEPGAGDSVDLLEPEGVPLARFTLTEIMGSSKVALGSPTWLSPRPERPFEVWHRSTREVEATNVTVLLDHAVDTSAIVERVAPGRSVLLLVTAAVEREGAAEPNDVELCRQVRSLSAKLQSGPTRLGRVECVVVPVSRDHPERIDRLSSCAHAYARGGEVLDLTSISTTGEPRRSSGAVLLFSGLSGSGKSTLARALRNRLLERSERSVTLLDGDVVRRHLSAGLGFGLVDRDVNVRRIGWVAARIAEHGGLAICSPIAPFETTRRAVRDMTTRAGGQFVLVHVATPLEECERRDRKGLYVRARRGEIADFTGISSPYEEPVNPDLRLDTTGQDIDELTERILRLGVQRQMWPALTTLGDDPARSGVAGS